MSWHVYGCLSLFLIISLLYSWKLYLHVRQKQETVPLEEFLPYVKLGKAVGGQGRGVWGKHRSGDFNWKSSLPSTALALPPFPHITNGKLQRMTSPRPTIKSPQSQKAPLSVLNLAVHGSHCLLKRAVFNCRRIGEQDKAPFIIF